MFEKSKIFFSEFERIFSSGSEFRAEAEECYESSSKFTPFITKRINEIIAKMGYIPMNEYLRIDSIGYTDKKEMLREEEFLRLQLWDLEIAVEHENAHKNWLDEVIKLAHISCPLRVVIGYVPPSQRPDGDKIRLDYTADVLSRLQCRENLKYGELLIILGNSRESKDDFFGYKAYVLDYEKFSFEELKAR